MYRIILFVAFSFSTLFSFSQINFEKGYFIDNDGKKTECFIKNRDWLKSPKDFKYKIEMNGEVMVEKVQNLKEFAIGDNLKFLRVEVDIDKSKTIEQELYFNPSELSENEEPIWAKEFVVMKLIIKGKANLYYSENDEIKRFFYNVDDGPIKLLINKDYSPDGFKVRTNRGFQKQLKEDVSCENNKRIYVEKMSYTINELEKYFIAFNSCYQ